MTYAQLLALLSSMPKEQLALSITIHTNNTYFPAEVLITDNKDTQLGHDYPYFKIIGEE